MCTVARQNDRLYSLMNTLLHNTVVIVSIGILILTKNKHRLEMSVRRRKFTILDRIPAQMKNLSYLCKGCLGSLDETYIDVHVPITEKGRYRNRNGQVSVNILGVCDMNMIFVYILSGWEGSAADSHVLRNAINRENGLKVTRGNYYLCDNRYPNYEDFLTPYKGVRYHLNEWTSRRPQTYQDLMDPFGNPMGYDADRVKFVHGRRSWSKIEEDVLILCLTNVVHEGWKSENGFKAGFQRELEKGVRKIFPGTDIVANPHINSKIHVWKKEYGVLSDLLSKVELDGTQLHPC
ncbi:hypothetical protein ACS0TY_022711 [Phlomoides rotata]